MKFLVAFLIVCSPLLAQSAVDMSCGKHYARGVGEVAKEVLLFQTPPEDFAEILNDQNKKSCWVNAVAFIGFTGGDKEAKMLYDIVIEKTTLNDAELQAIVLGYSDEVRPIVYDNGQYKIAIDKTEWQVRLTALMALGNLARRCVTSSIGYILAVFDKALMGDFDTRVPYPADPNIMLANLAIRSLGEIGLIEIENILDKFKRHKVYGHSIKDAIKVSKRNRSKNCVP